MRLALRLPALALSEGAVAPVRARPASRPGSADPAGVRAAPRAGARRAYLLAILAGGAISSAWLVPETAVSAVLGWLGAFLIVAMVRARAACLPAYCCGLIGHAVGFYWVFSTVWAFGGFGAVPAALVFLLFVVTGALQFLLFAFIHHNLGSVYEALALRSPTAIVLSELLSVRLFRWHFGHTQIAFTPFVQIAGIGGAMAVSFLLFWVAEVCVRVVVERQRKKVFLVPAALFGLALGYGAIMVETYGVPRGESQTVVLVQGNASLAEKRDVESARRNLERLHDLSRGMSRAGALIVWPEGSIPTYIPEDVGLARNDPALPWFGDGSAWLVGSYSYDDLERRYNAAFAVYPDGRVPQPYFKQILIPFGESMPFATFLPWLNGMNARAGVFTAGTETKVFSYPVRRSDGTSYTLRLSPLICYEDTVPALSRAATRKGAELLVNLTSDSWFGRSVAAHQHHLIAAFRAIENRRYLVRATNTGLSAVVDPLGRTIARIPPFTEGTAAVKVSLLKDQSAYASLVGERPWWTLLAVSLGAMAVRWMIAHAETRRTRRNEGFRGREIIV